MGKSKRKNAVEQEYIEGGKPPKRWKKALAITLACIFSFFALSATILGIGVLHTRATWAYWRPDYAKTDIAPLLSKATLTEEEYAEIYYQTGMAKLAVDDMRDTSEGREKILVAQEFMFSDYEIDRVHFAPFTYKDELKDGTAVLADLQDGDILVTATTYVSWWRYGHSALVIDGENGVMLECFGPGEKSMEKSAEKFAKLPNFMVLRPKVNSEIKAEVVAYAKAKLLNLSYSFTVGIFSKKNQSNPKKTQCAHLVWQAYKHFGVDLDSNGGKIVKPRDFVRSVEVDVVQAFGFDLNSLWGRL